MGRFVSNRKEALSLEGLVAYVMRRRIGDDQFKYSEAFTTEEMRYQRPMVAYRLRRARAEMRRYIDNHYQQEDEP